jgi:farnesyl diphosphate synthase
MNELAQAVTLEDAMAEAARLVEGVLDDVLPRPGGPETRLYEAMRYATLGGGKRLRPFLTRAAGRLCGAPDRRALRAGAAIELVHAYSLVHDDLPAMDDDDLRRGRPTCHIAFGEATAILAGDALLTLAFEVLADAETHPDGAVRSDLVRLLAEAAGARGMVGGQMLDLTMENRAASHDEIARMENLKTGAMIACACEAGATVAGAAKADRAALRAYGQDVGLAFQIADDLLDVESTAAETGKTVGKDQAHGKSTFVAALGVKGARAEAERLVARATARLDGFGERAAPLRQVARFIVERRA